MVVAIVENWPMDLMVDVGELGVMYRQAMARLWWGLGVEGGQQGTVW